MIGLTNTVLEQIGVGMELAQGSIYILAHKYHLIH